LESEAAGGAPRPEGSKRSGGGGGGSGVAGAVAAAAGMACGLAAIGCGGYVLREPIRVLLNFFISAVDEWGIWGYVAYALVYAGLEVR
jgi:hypothetical protein